MSKKWNYKVVKRMRGGDGRYFSYPCAATFATMDEAVDYARTFAASQHRRHCTTARIIVVSRRGNHTVAEINTGAPNRILGWEIAA